MISDILDYGADFDGRPFLVCRSREATTLAELARPIAFIEALEIIEQIAVALIPAHAERLAHGGLEPSSVTLVRGPDDRPRVLGVLASAWSLRSQAAPATAARCRC